MRFVDDSCDANGETVKISLRTSPVLLFAKRHLFKKKKNIDTRKKKLFPVRSQIASRSRIKTVKAASCLSCTFISPACV